MGDAKRNIYVNSHWEDGDTTYTAKHRVHQTNLSLDTISPELSAADHESLVAAAKVGLVAFGAKVSDIGGSYEDWYDGLNATSQQKLCVGLSKGQG